MDSEVDEECVGDDLPLRKSTGKRFQIGLHRIEFRRRKNYAVNMTKNSMGALGQRDSGGSGCGPHTPVPHVRGAGRMDKVCGPSPHSSFASLVLIC